MKFHASLKHGYAGYSAYLDNADFTSAEDCRQEIERLGLTKFYEVKEGSILEPMKPFFPKG